MIPRVAILGRPNVGKSTLFNRLVGARRALVHDTPGVTRDRIEAEARLEELGFIAVDTAGFELGLKGPLSERLVAIARDALATADVGLLIVDARSGLTALDHDIAASLRGGARPVILVANKCEGRAAESLAAEAYALGLGDPVMVSAEHGLGLDALAEALRPHLAPADAADAAGEATAADEDDDEEDDGVLRLAVVGRPNTGKSSLLNRLLDDERLLTGPEPGLTRDAVDIVWEWRGRPIALVDTAGLRRKARIEERLEKLSASSTMRAVRSAHVVVLMVDAANPLEKQDLTIANLVLDQGRALVLAINKWDLVEDERATLAEIRHRLKHRLSQLREPPMVTMSVLTGRGVGRLLPTVVDTFERWQARVSTGRLNRWLQAATAQNPPPMAQNRRIKLRYATQVSTRPPTIAVFSNKPADALPASYLRYLATGFAESFDLKGVQVRFVVRHGENPYAEA